MKTLKKTLAPLICAAIMAVPFVSCGDDDEPDNPETTENRLAAITSAGMNLFTFSYDASGRITRISSSEIELSINIGYSPLRLEINEDGEATTMTDITTNSLGYITGMTCSDADETWVMALSYDQSGHLTRMRGNDVDDTVLSWSGGNLMKATNDDGSTTYKYTKLVNRAGVFSPLWDPMGPYWMTGLFGVAPVNFPASITNYDDETAEFAYKLNTDGTIAAEQVTSDGYTVTLSYKYVTSRAAESDNIPEKASVGIPEFRSPFKLKNKK